MSKGHQCLHCGLKRLLWFLYFFCLCLLVWLCDSVWTESVWALCYFWSGKCGYKLLRDLVLVSSLCMICVIEREMTVGSFPINWRCLFSLPWEEFLLYFIMSNVCSFASVVDILCGCDRALNSGHGFMEFSVKTRAWFILNCHTCMWVLMIHMD